MARPDQRFRPSLKLQCFKPILSVMSYVSRLPGGFSTVGSLGSVPTAPGWPSVGLLLNEHEGP